jgi:hypothetical protein
MSEKKEISPEWLAGGLFLAGLVAVVLIYNWLDSFLFGSHRPWTLFLALVQLVLLGGGLACFVLVLMRLWKSAEHNLGVACAVLTPCFGLGPLIAFIWGWFDANRLSKAGHQDHQKVMLLMKVWSAVVACQLLLSGYVWYYTPAVNKGGGPISRPPTRTEPTERDCYQCNGRGRNNCHICFGNPRLRASSRCHACSNAGSISCTFCYGTGRRR